MGDLSTEPSMEEILSSIKRIIAEEGEQPARRVRPARGTPSTLPAASPEEEVLELSEPLPSLRAPDPEPEPQPRPETPIAAQPGPEPARPQEPVAMPQPARAPETTGRPEPIVSTEAAAASRGALETLSRLLVKPEPDSDGTLEGLVREMLRPMLREWLDANLPEIVETLVSREIARIANQAR
jgi:cell pole-organizing protein PopZ